MANDFYQIFREDCKRLARTMVIRHEVSAEATNRYLALYGIEVLDDKRTWRYYMNIAGLYHSTNEMMQVKSLDTGELIDFTRENLKIHRATARGYAYGSRYYKALASQWKRQERLIKGILNPVDIDVAINARENEIIWMPPELVDENEDNLKELIQAQIDAGMDRWHVEMYSLTEDLYDCSRYAVLYAHLPAFIEFARWKNSRTFRAHSFHIREFLAANGKLDVFMDAMTKEQQLFFYRNLPYLHRYPGHADTFEWLKEWVLEKRLFPLADYTLSQNTEKMPTDLEPTIELIRQETTADYAGVLPTKHDVRSILRKQEKLALRNAETIDDNEIETTQLMQLSQVSTMQTKVLESDVLDMSDSQVFKLKEFLIYHWAYLAYEDRYRALVTIENPRTGEPITLSALDAFIFFLYTYNLSQKQVLTVVPNMHVNCVLKNPKPLPPEMFNAVCLGPYATMEHAEAVWDLMPELGSYISTESFYDAVNAVYNAAVDQHNMAAFHGHYQVRAEVEALGLYMFMDYGINLGNEEPYEDWLRPRGLLPIKDYNTNELDLLWNSLLQTATGMDLNTSLSLNDIHRSMIGIMQRLSSYSVHYIRSMNSSPLLALDNKFIRIGDSLGVGQGAHEYDILKLKEIHGYGQVKGSTEIDVLNDVQIREEKTELEGTSQMIFGLYFEEQTEKHGYSNVPLPYLRAFEPVLRPVTDLDGMKFTSDIIVGPLDPSDEHIGEVLVVRTLSGLNYPTGNAPIPVPLNQVITNRGLSGLEYPDE